MKLLKLTISNIASVEHAEIDFTGDVLGQAKLFIINGETGSGKSTILDAICLALYNDTPRLSKNIKDKILLNNDQINIFDNRQLLRRNTGKGGVELTFEGNDGKHYRATWSVHRAHGKTDGNLSNLKRTLECEGTTYVKGTEINAAIKEAVGLNFDEFCRTTLLAQGRFTEFLKSDDGNRSAILEKLTGTEVYSRIGQKIYEITRQKADDYSRLKAKIDDVKLLSDDQEQALRADLERSQKEADGLGNESKRLQGIINWIADRQKAEAGKASIESEVRNVESVLQSDQAQQEARTVDDWDKSAKARAQLEQIGSNEKQLAALEGKSTQLAADFARLKSGLKWLEADTKRTEQAAATVQKWIDDNSAHRHMLEQAQTIAAKLRECLQLDRDTMKARRDIDKQQETLAAIGREVKRMKELKTNEERQAETFKTEEAALRTDYAKRNPKAIEEKRNKAEARALLLGKTQLAIGRLNQLADYEARVQGKVNEAKTKLNELKAKEPQLKTEEAQAKERCDRANEQYDKVKLSLDDNIKELRSRLKAGDTCPLCGHVIDGELTTEAFESALLPLQAEREKAQAALTKAASANGLNAKAANELQKQLADAGTELAKAARDASEARATAKQLWQELELSGEPSEEVAKREMQIASDAKQQAQKDLDEANTMRDLADGKQKEAEKHSKAVATTDAKLAELREKSATAKARIESLEQAIKSYGQRAEGNLKWADGVITISGWRDAWTRDGQGVIDRIGSEAKQLSDKEKELNRLNAVMTEAKANLQNAANRLNDLNTFNSLWGQLPAQEPTKVDGLADKASILLRHATEWRTARESLKEANDEYHKAVNEFCQSSGIAPERIAMLGTIGAEAISGMKQRLGQLNEQLLKLQGRLKAACDTMANLNSQKPEMADGDATESLQQQLDECRKMTNELNQRIGQQRQQLSDNENTKAQVSSDRQKLKALEDEWLKWDKLCSDLGDNNGKKLRTIAQSFILRNLLHDANDYMRHFTQRYRLTCGTDSLSILIEDNFNGGVRTTANTLSGGEGFMASLALALALARIQGREFAVDTLFIDEGFGTLDENCLDTVVSTLERLQSIGGRKVGIISHMEALSARIHTQVQVRRDPACPTRSTVTVTTT